MINYRFNIIDKLGEGGSGEVFLVDDTLRENQRLAMKVFHRPAGADGSADEQLKSEVSFLTTLLHPNLVRVFDFDAIRQAEISSLIGCRFYTMEYVQGMDALQWCRASSSDEDRGERVRLVALQTLSALSLIHGRGIIHFDIKPENLLIMAGLGDGKPPVLKLMDFGFSVKQDAAQEVSLRGTLQYTAPELLRHEQHDCRVDLYSLGATLFQLLEDHCPFEDEQPVELVKKILNAEPEFVRAENVAPSLISLTKTLLQKQPDERFQTAEETALSLGAGKRELGSFEFKPRFVGRSTALERICAAIDGLGKEAAADQPVAITITGSEGIGKTSLLHELARYGRLRDIPVFELNGQGRYLQGGAIGRVLVDLKVEALSRSVQAKALIDRLAEMKDGDAEHVMQAQVRFLVNTAALFPYVIHADDLDEMDPETADVLRLTASSANPGTMLLLASAKTGEDPQAIGLEELTGSEVQAMCASVLSPAVLASAISEALVRLYGGAPALIVEALRSVGLLLPADLGDGRSIRPGLVESIVGMLPRDLDKFLVARCRGLDKERRLGLAVLSCFQSPARLEVIEAVLPFQKQRTAQYLSSLEAAGLLVSSDGGQRYSLRQAKLQSIVYAEAGESMPETHAFIASIMEEWPGKNSILDLEETAVQYARAGDDARASRWYGVAADQAMEQAAFRRSIELFEKAIARAATLDQGRALELNVKQVSALFHAGRFREAVDKASALLRDRGLSSAMNAELLKVVGLSQLRLGNYNEATESIVAAIPMTENEVDQLSLLQEVIAIEINLGNFENAERGCFAQLARAQKLGHPALLASIHTNLGIATFYQQQFDRSVEWFGKALNIYAETGQHTREADALMNIGNVLSAKGDTAAAIVHWQDALAKSREFGTLDQEARIRNNLGIAYYKMKRYGEAKQSYGEARSLFTRIGSKEGTAYVLTNLGEVTFAEGEYEKAAQQWNDARALYSEMDDAQGLVESTLQLAQAYQVMGDANTAEARLEEAQKLIKEREIESFQGQLHALRGMHYLSRRDFSSARPCFEAASIDPQVEADRQAQYRLRMAECDMHLGKHESAATIAREVLAYGEGQRNAPSIADALFLLGQIATVAPSVERERPLILYKKGFEAIAKEPVTELTWKLAFSLGREFHERGQGERSREFLVKARVILQFFLGQFTSSELRDLYAKVDRKDKVLAVIEAALRS